MAWKPQPPVNYPGLPIWPTPPQPPYIDNQPPMPQPPLGEERGPLVWLRLFFPGYFDPNSPNYIDPQSVILGMLIASEPMRPPCLSEKMQNIAQAYYTAFLLQDWLKNSDSGGSGTTNSGIVTQESEGDISVSYAEPAGYTDAESGPPNSAWDKWNKLWQLCAKGAILTKYGDPT